MANFKTQVTNPSQAKDQFSDSLASRLMTHGWDVKEVIRDQILNNHTQLSSQEYKEINDAVVNVHRKKATMLPDLRAAGLVDQLGGLGSMFTEYQNISDMTEAEISMDGETATEEDQRDKGWVPTPVPLISKRFRLNMRKLEASRKMGNDLDTSHAEEASTQVTRKIDSMIFSTNFTYGGSSVNGLIDVVSNSDGDLDQNWDGSLGNIWGDLNTLAGNLFDKGYEGPMNVYMAPTNYKYFWNPEQQGTIGDTGQTIQEFVEDHPLINKVDYSAGVPANHAVVVQMTSDVIQWKEAETITTVDWESGSGFTRYWMVFSAGAPVIKKDNDGNYGIEYCSDVTA